jgi:RNA polymerase sigma-70 factor (ECF subfamily)
MDDLELKFQKIYDEYHARIHGYLRRMVGDGHAEDLTQDVFVKIGQALENFRGESKLSTWIYRIATNAALDHLRSSPSGGGGKLNVEDISDLEADKNVWTGEKEKPTDQKMIRREMNACIRQVIETLPESYKLVIVLSDLEGLRDHEIAEITGSSLQATKIRIHRARVRLKSELEKTCVFYRDDGNEFACERKGSSTDDPFTR